MVRYVSMEYEDSRLAAPRASEVSVDSICLDVVQHEIFIALLQYVFEQMFL